MKRKLIYVLYKDNHPAFKTLYNNPPKTIKFLFDERAIEKDFGVIDNKDVKIDRKSNKIPIFIKKILFYLKSLYKNFLDILNLPIIVPVLPSNKFHYDYILSFPLVLSNKKFISYVDYIAIFVNFKDRKLRSRISLSIIRRFLLSNRCKYVFNWSKSSKKILIDVLKIPKKKQYKFKTIYPSIEPMDFNKKNNQKSINLLFISSIAKFDKDFNFYMKGGKLVLQAYEELKARYDNIHLKYIGYVPMEFRERFEKLSDIAFYQRVPYEQIFEMYRCSDIFLFPTYGDIFGFAFIEAMSFGLPIIAINNNFAATEMVINNKTGFLIETSQKFLMFPFSKYCPEWVDKWVYIDNLKKEDDLIGLKNLIEKLELLIQNKELREKLGRNGRERLVTGDLSIENRNNKLYNLFKD